MLDSDFKHFQVAAEFHPIIFINQTSDCYFSSGHLGVMKK